MDDAFVVSGGQRVYESGRDRHQALDRHAAFGDQPVESLPIDELRGQEVAAVRLLELPLAL